MSFIDAHDFPAGLVLRVLGIAESTYYDWRARRVSPSRRELDDAVSCTLSSRRGERGRYSIIECRPGRVYQQFHASCWCLLLVDPDHD